MILEIQGAPPDEMEERNRLDEKEWHVPITSLMRDKLEIKFMSRLSIRVGL